MNNQSKGRKPGAKNKERVSWEQLDTSRMMLKGFTMSQNELRMRICRECGPLAGLLYIQLLAHHNKTSGKCFPSTSTLEKETCISKRKISDLITVLHNAGYIIVRSGGRGHSSHYWFPYEDFFDPNDIDMRMAYKRKTAMNRSKPTSNKDEYDASVTEADDIDDDELF